MRPCSLKRANKIPVRFSHGIFIEYSNMVLHGIYSCIQIRFPNNAENSSKIQEDSAYDGLTGIVLGILLDLVRILGESCSNA
jgi:hypothetical protein